MCADCTFNKHKHQSLHNLDEKAYRKKQTFSSIYAALGSDICNSVQCLFSEIRTEIKSKIECQSFGTSNVSDGKHDVDAH